MPLKFYDEFSRLIQSWKQRKFFVKIQRFWCFFLLFEGGRHLLPHFSQPFFHKIIMFLCLLERKFPELFKTHPTFFSSAHQKAKKSKYAKFTLLFGAPWSSFKMAQKNCWGIYYQMDHIWWASSRLKKSAGLKMRSQLNHTLFHLSVATLYICWCCLH